MPNKPRGLGAVSVEPGRADTASQPRRVERGFCSWINAEHEMGLKSKYWLICIFGIWFMATCTGLRLSRWHSWGRVQGCRTSPGPAGAAITKRNYNWRVDLDPFYEGERKLLFVLYFQIPTWMIPLLITWSLIIAPSPAMLPSAHTAWELYLWWESSCVM